MENIFCENFLKWVEEQPEAIAIQYKKQNISYGELNHAVKHVIVQLTEEGVCSGDNVAVYMSNSVEMVTSILALMFLGGNIVPIHSMEEQNKIEIILQDGKCSKILCNNISYNEIERFDCEAILINNLEDSYVNSPELDNSYRNPSHISQLICFKENAQGQLVQEHSMNWDDLASQYISSLSLDESSVLCLSQSVDLLDTITVMAATFTVGAKYVIFEQVVISNPVELLKKASEQQITVLWLESAYLKKVEALRGFHPNELNVNTIVLNDKVETLIQENWMGSEKIKRKSQILGNEGTSWETEGKIYKTVMENNNVKECVVTENEHEEYFIFYVSEETITNQELEELVSAYSCKLYRLNRFYYDDNFGFDVKKNIEMANKIAQMDKEAECNMTVKEDLIFNLLEVKMRALGINGFSELDLQKPLDEIGLDSIIYMQIVVWLEDTLHIMFDDDKFGVDAFENCYEIVTYVAQSADIQ